MRRALSVCFAWAVLLAAGPVLAHEAGDLVTRVGATWVDPKQNNNDIVDVDDAWSAGVTVTYFIKDWLALDLLAAWPFEHDIKLKDPGGTKVGSTKHLPPTLSVQYHFIPDGAVQPYVGVGVNYTYFFDEDTSGPLSGADLDLDNSWGYALQLGFDFEITERIVGNLDFRYISIKSENAEVDDTDIGDVEIDPFVGSLMIGYKFGLGK
jgi:outer membrane protein